MAKNKVLIVETERLVAKRIAGMLDQAGYSSTIATSGPDALRKIDRQKPDLILIDIVLQDGMDGFESVRLMRSRCDVPIIYLTGYSNKEFVEAAKKNGAFGYILKPFEDRELQIAVELALSLYAKAKSLQQEQARRDMFLDLAADIFCLLDSELRIREVNGGNLGKWGLSKDDLLGKEIVDFLAPSERRRCLAKFRRVWQTGKPSAVPELILPEKYGNHVVRLQLSKVGEWLGLVISDITLRKRLESALKESEARYRMIVESMNEGVVVQDGKGRITYANDMFQKMSGYDNEDILGHLLSEFVGQNCLDDFRARMNAITREGNRAFELMLKGKAGQRIQTISSVMFLHDDRGDFKGSVVILADLTERQQVEDELRRSRQELRDLSRHLQSIKEEESKRIAREIHDELGQVLTVLKIDLSRLSHRLKDSELDRKLILDKIKSMMMLLDKTIKVIQKISAELRPGLLDDLGLVPAIEWQAEEFEERTGVKCRLSANAMDAPLEPDCATAVFRIVQEALTNVARHANASAVEISIEKRARRFNLMIRDNGQGITPEDASSSNSLGLIGMRERLLPFGGTIQITGTPNKGTTLLLSVELENNP